MEKVKREIVEKIFGSWKTKGSGVSFARKIQDEAEKREKYLGL